MFMLAKTHYCILIITIIYFLLSTGNYVRILSLVTSQTTTTQIKDKEKCISFTIILLIIQDLESSRFHIPDYC